MRRTRSAKTALSSIARNRLRTALTMLGLVIGISSVIVLVGLGEGSNRQVEERMKALGGDMVSAYVFKDSLGYDDIAALRGLPGMGSVAPSKGVGGDLTDEGRSTKRSTAEVSDEHYLTTRSLRLATGRNLSPVDRENRSNVCVIGASTANDLFGTMDCLGKTLKIAGVPFVVVGVLEPIGQTMGLNADNLALVPFSALPSLGEETKIETVYARPALEGGVDATKAALFDYLSGERGLSPNQFAVVSQDDMLNASSEINQTMTLVVLVVTPLSICAAGAMA